MLGLEAVSRDLKVVGSNPASDDVKDNYNFVVAQPLYLEIKVGKLRSIKKAMPTQIR